MRRAVALPLRRMLHMGGVIDQIRNPGNDFMDKQERIRWPSPRGAGPAKRFCNNNNEWITIRKAYCMVHRLPDTVVLTSDE